MAQRPLRIFLSAQQDSGVAQAVPAYRFWTTYFRAALAEAGHTCLEVAEANWAAGLTAMSPSERAAWSDRVWSLTIAFLRREHAREPIDFFLGYLFPSQVQPAAVAEIRALGIPCVNFFCDNVREFRRIPEVYRSFDLHWVPEFAALPLYARAGLATLHAPMACWVPPAQRTPVARETLPITFVGTRDVQRERLFAAALANGLRADLRGPGWDSPASIPVASPAPAKSWGESLRRQWEFIDQHGAPALLRKVAYRLRPPSSPQFDFSPYARPAEFGDAYWPLLREASVCLGVNRYPSLRHPLDRPDTYSRLRDIEAPMAGACYLTELAPGLDELYDLGVEIETYRTPEELVSKARALDGDPARRTRLRAAGQRRALAEHTIGRTLERIAERLGCR